jgi:hypothetical protein
MKRRTCGGEMDNVYWIEVNSKNMKKLLRKYWRPLKAGLKSARV